MVRLSSAVCKGSKGFRIVPEESTMDLKVNGRTHTVEVDTATPLLYVLSDARGLPGPKLGGGLGQCGSCRVIVKGQAIRSCITPVGPVAGSEITPLEGLGTINKP